MKKRERDLVISALRKSELSTEALETASFMGPEWCLGNIFKAVRQIKKLNNGTPRPMFQLRKAIVVEMTQWCIYLLYLINKEEKDHAKRVKADSESV